MSIYHLSVKAVSRSSGRSAVSAAAYRSGTRLRDARTGLVHDYRRKRGVLHTAIVLPPDVSWRPDRAALWNAAEAAERRVDSTTAREHEVALPAALTPEQRLQLVFDYCSDLAERHRCAVDFAVHAPSAEGDERNFHAHILCTTRAVAGVELTGKCRREKSKTVTERKLELQLEREIWEVFVNHALEQAHIDDRIDHRSLKDQGIESNPPIHLGPAVTAMVRRGKRSRVAELGSGRQRNRAKIESPKKALIKKRAVQDRLSTMRERLRKRQSLNSQLNTLQPERPKEDQHDDQATNIRRGRTQERTVVGASKAHPGDHEGPGST